MSRPPRPRPLPPALVAVHACVVLTVLLAGVGTAVRLERARVVAAPAPGPGRTPTPSPSPAAASPTPERQPLAGPTSAAPRPADRARRSPSPPPPLARRGSGRLVVVPGRSDVHGSGPLHRFVVEVEAGLGEEGSAFAAAVERVLFDPRGWIAGGRALQRVDRGPVAFRIVLAGPATTDRLCAPLDTGGHLSCFQRGRAVVNVVRWQRGARAYGDDVASYRIYLVNHEVGHALGRGHRDCPGRGLPAPVMMQQTKGLGACRPNPWPLPGER